MSTANPTGAGNADGMSSAAEAFTRYMEAEKAQPDAGEAAAEANRDDEARPRDERGRFAPAEPDAETDQIDDEAEAAPDEGDDAEAAESEPHEADDDDAVELADTIDGLAEQLGISPEDLAGSLKVKVKVDGEERLVNLSDAVNGYQMESDYRRKTQQISERAKEIDQRVAQIEQERRQYQEVLTPLIQSAYQDLVADEASLEGVLDEYGAEEYTRRRHKLEQKQRNFQTLVAQHQQMQQRQAQEMEQQRRKAMADSESKLYERFPEWRSSPEKGRQEISGLRDYIVEQGIRRDLANQVFDADQLMIAWKAREYDRLQKAKPERLKSVKGKPKVLKPGPSRPKEDPKAKVKVAAINRLRKTGRVDDAAAVFSHMGLGSRKR